MLPFGSQQMYTAAGCPWASFFSVGPAGLAGVKHGSIMDRLTFRPQVDSHSRILQRCGAIGISDQVGWYLYDAKR